MVRTVTVVEGIVTTAVRHLYLAPRLLSQPRVPRVREQPHAQTQSDTGAPRVHVLR